MRVASLLAIICFCFLGESASATELKAVIDKSEQSMTVFLDGQIVHEWSVSTGRQDGWTPTGTFHVQSMDANHHSHKYHNAPMPWAIFFDGNRATHGTTKVEDLGKRASNGCVRLHPDNAQILFEMVLAAGAKNTVIVVQN